MAIAGRTVVRLIESWCAGFKKCSYDHYHFEHGPLASFHVKQGMGPQTGLSRLVLCGQRDWPVGLIDVHKTNGLVIRFSGGCSS